ncbi:putative copper transporter crmD like protein [Verticillium longisporum]|uniref:Copper transport protein n=2 Tax=Verticillium longisporum TaxID=100787 RepID=A0A0G4LBS6_VERLO|nr:putative copper transporter crmD like protein [Verticillium longisporum]KAG7117442.1 putative copper transporter crmD like protein [Verticillium longisporum]CRK19364.1 hypothetical protein BN1723_002563 [Verticillium longisporum]
MEARAPHGDTAHDATTAASTDGSSTGGHEMGMMVIFQNMIQTSLYSEAWTPNSVGTYAATCIFLIVLASLLRVMLAGKALLEQRWLDQELKRRYVVVADKNTLGQQLSSDSLAKQMVISENGREENVTVVQRKHGLTRPWRFSVDPVRALLDTVIAGVGYLLMLAVMSMNVGYFLSVLGGVFLGSIAVGRYAIHSGH